MFQANWEFSALISGNIFVHKGKLKIFELKTFNNKLDQNGLPIT